MSFSFQNQGYNTFLCYEVDADKEIDSLSVGMLTNNKINGFVQTLFSQVDEKRYLRYNVTSKVSARQFFAGVINKKRLLSVFSGITKAYLLAEEYMLDTTDIIFDLDYIFVDVSTAEVSLVCLPVKNAVENVDPKMFFKDILLNSQFDQSENGDYFAKLLNYFNSSDKINFDSFNSFLNSLNNFNINDSAKQNSTSFTKDNGSVVFEAPAVDNVATVPVAAVSIDSTPVTISAPGVVNCFPNQQAHQNVPGSFVPLNSQKTAADKTEYSEFEYENTAVSEGSISDISPVATEQKNDKSKEKKSGGMFSFLHKEKKEKAQKPEKTSKKTATTSTVKNDAFGNIAIPGQVVPPTVKTATKKDTETKTAFSTAVNKPIPAATEQSVQKTNYSMNSAVQRAAVSVKIQTQEPVSVQMASVPTVSGTVNFGETTVLGGGLNGETTVLGMDMNVMAPMPHIIRSKNHEKININKPIFRIGKERSYVDYFVADNTAISRSHANIITREGRYFIVDTNSTNHTFIDGQMIPSNSECEIGHGTKIRLANEDFEFNLY